jgi:hypothetical protein
MNQFSSGYRFLTVFGSQKRTYDCEKRCVRFGICCLPRILDSIEEGIQMGIHDIKCGNKGCGLKVPVCSSFTGESKTIGSIKYCVII